MAKELDISPMTAGTWARLILISIPTWLLVGAIHLVFIVLGLALVALESFNVKQDENGRLQFAARWMWLYNNPEDGIDGCRGGDWAQLWWLQRTCARTLRERIFLWSALRNPVNNLRYVPFISPKFRPESIRSVGTGDEPPNGESGWAYVWQGIYSGLYIKRPHVWFWIGWKFRPSDAQGIKSTDTRLPRADFAMQLQHVQESKG